MLFTANNIAEIFGAEDKLDIDKVKDSRFTQRFNQYKKLEAEGKYSEAAMYEEVLTLASEAMASGDLKFEQSVFVHVDKQNHLPL